MKSSLPPLAALPPLASVQPLPALPGTGLQQARDAAQRDHAAGEPKAERRGAVAFRSPRPNANRNNPPPKLAQSRPAQIKPRQAGPASAPASPDVAAGNPSSDTELSELEDEFDNRRDKLGYSLRANTAHHESSERGGTDEGGHQERLFKSIQLSSLIGMLAAEPSPALAQAVQSLLTAHSVEALARPLRGLVRDAGALDGAAPLQSLVFKAAKSWLQRQPGAPEAVSGGTTSLGEIRAALLEGNEPALAQATEQQAAAHVWLPVYLLNLDRPRTPRQRQQAIERLDMIERRVLASAQRRAE